MGNLVSSFLFAFDVVLIVSSNHDHQLAQEQSAAELKVSTSKSEVTVLYWK